MFKCLSVSLSGLCLLASTATAAVDGFFAVVNSSSSYTVPTGKVLVLQAYYFNSANANATILRITPKSSNFSADWLASTNSSGTVTYANPIQLSSPLKFPQGTVFAGVATTTSLYGQICDTADLYVANNGIQSGFTQFASVGTNMQGQLTLGARMPADIRIQTSTNLTSWSYDHTVTVRPTSNRTVVALSTPKDSSATQKYFRGVVRKRPS